MYDSRPLSARIEKETIDKIDALVKKHSYWTRNYVIDKLLWVITHDFDEQSIYEMARRNKYGKFTGVAQYMGYFDEHVKK